MPFCLAQDTLAPGSPIMIVLVALAFAMGVSALAGVLRSRSVLGPARMKPDQPLWPIAFAGAVSAVAWMGLQAVYAANKAAQFTRAHPGEHFDLSQNLTADDYAFLATVPFIVGFAVLLVLDQVIDSRLANTIAPLPRKIIRAIGPAIVGLLIILPLILVASVLLDALYRAVGYQHPNSHELLGAMKEVSSPFTRIMLILGACVLAPLFEECLFRGHLQTFLVYLGNRPKREIETTPLPSTEAATPPEGNVLPYQSPPPLDRSPDRVWMAILGSSIIFSIVHPLWMAPLIFVLAIGLGYAYERTGNIWTSILIHALFNTLNTIYFLNLG